MKDRITVVERIYHERDRRETHEFDNGFCRDLVRSEQTYEREVTVGSSPRPIDLGWLRGIADTVVVANAGPSAVVVRYADQEKGFLVRAGEHSRFNPTDPDSLVVYSASLEVSDCIIIVIPG